MTYDTFLRTKDTFDKLEASKNLGEETSARDAKAKKTKYKKGKDDGRKRLHKARWNRQPLVPPEEFYKKVPKKQATVIRHFPMEHLGITGQVPDATITHMHNRAVKVVFDSFCKPTFKAARNGEKAGKYADLFQLLEAFFFVVRFFISIFRTIVYNFHNTFIYIRISGIYYGYF
jgi:hypothetical protein